jgi:tRNA A37 threonylcarbamoyltransferase TsaD
MKKDLKNFPFLALTISGGHTQIIKWGRLFTMTIIMKPDDAV